VRIVRLGLLDNGSSIFDTTLKQKCVGGLHSNTNSVAAAVGSPYSVTTIRLLKKRYRRCVQSSRSNGLKQFKPFKKFKQFKSLKSRLSPLRSFWAAYQLSFSATWQG